MDSVGAILKAAREEKNLPLEQVSSDTHILPGYIRAIEENRFQDLPGEAYCAGFIGTLARYYKLDSSHLTAMFRGIPQNEKSAPAPKHKAPVIRTEKKNLIPVILIIVLLLLMITAVLFIFTGREKAPEPVAQEEQKTNVYVMSEVLFEPSFSENDIVQVQMGESSSEIVCRSVGASVVLGTKGGNVTLTPLKEEVLDLDGDSKKDVKVSLKEVNTEAGT
ncbi:MAG: helix-turn-helix domain-containing protein, partial [Spirochaetia bacterium]|nr:helix-turn-helix domain-containing protein [Spirochaetia bacterium]